MIAYTAGTTASPKGAMLTHGNLAANLDQMSAVPRLALSHHDVALLALPLFHIYALNAVLGMSIKHRAAVLLMERFDPTEALRLIEHHGVTVLLGAPPMFAAWLALPEPVPSMTSVRLAISGASALPADVLSEFRRRFGITIWEGYGLTECAPAVTSNAVGEEAKPNSIGLPIPGVEVRLVGEHGEDIDEDDPGELHVRGPNVFAGYWNKPEATGEVLDGTHCGDPPPGHQHQRVREPHDLLHGMAHIDDGDAQVVAQLLDKGQDLGAVSEVEGRQRLVHEQKACIGEQRAADCDALLLAAGKMIRLPLEKRLEAQ